MPDAAADNVLLVVEDDQDDQILLVDALQATGYRPRLEFVQDGQELLDYLLCKGNYTDPKRAPRPSLVLLDLRMPDKDGLAVLEEVNFDSLPTRVIVLTAAEDDRDVVTLLDASGRMLFVSRAAEAVTGRGGEARPLDPPEPADRHGEERDGGDEDRRHRGADARRAEGQAEQLPRDRRRADHRERCSYACPSKDSATCRWKTRIAKALPARCTE